MTFCVDEPLTSQASGLFLMVPAWLAACTLYCICVIFIASLQYAKDYNIQLHKQFKRYIKNKDCKLLYTVNFVVKFVVDFQLNFKSLANIQMLTANLITLKMSTSQIASLV